MPSAVGENAMRRLSADLRRRARQARVPAGRVFGTALAAVVAASDFYNPRSIAEDREYMGAVLYRDGHYYYTAGAGLRGQDRITVRVPVPKGSDIIAFWHTHGAPRWERRFFSGVDTDLATSWKTPFYLADYTGTLRVFSPGDSTLSRQGARRLGLPPKRGFARGRIVRDEAGQAVQVSTSAGQLLRTGAEDSVDRHAPGPPGAGGT